jgi:NADPH:quinone reductase-like Zn-dependent oxidoreductase
VINVDQESLDAEKDVFDVVIDAVGRDVPEGLFAALRRGGCLITLQEPPQRRWPTSTASWPSSLS